jgi:hypothetical protein
MECPSSDITSNTNGNGWTIKVVKLMEDAKCESDRLEDDFENYEYLNDNFDEDE